MSPIIRTKYFYLPDNISCFINLAVVLHYEILELGSSYDRINIIFDDYLNQSWKEEHKIVEELDQGSESLNSLRFQKDLNVLIFFTHHPDNVNQYIRARFFMMHHKNQILVCTYQETISSSHQKKIEGNMEVTITAYQSKKQINKYFATHCIFYPRVFYFIKLS